MFSFRDHLVTVTPILSGGSTPGQPLVLGQAYRILSGNKVQVDSGASADHVAGFDELPFDIVRKGNKPKITLEGMDADEVRVVRERVGGIGGFRYVVSIVVQRPGVATVAIKVFPCEWSGGGGWNAEEGGATDKIESLAKDIHMNGRTIYARRHPR